ncbi:MAG: ATP synthase F1 subunit epsilon [Lachnospiraceae bacterium]|nr:ATP synthase F1 subunit epsilon [Lachnospiraceae bacterium]MCI7596433.1 ATP synthase F1 subunit epsilon [Lachnospiraceae bacterium]MDD7050948.1 ATP synthase F1 subunit epsilon [Lachnospiraceae bacterium]MDY3223747.1 ATP synthase F1 subunit epsilon [Lachnospiraceae bacterium]
MADERFFELEIITPDRVFYKDQVTMVEFNTTEGEIGIYPGHIPLTVIVKPGVLTITGEEKKEAALHTGFATILQDKVTIMAETVEWPEEIDLRRAEAAKERAETRLREGKTDTDIARAETALLRAMARIKTIK